AVGSRTMDEGIRIGVAAQALGVSVDTLRRWEREGRIAFERRGNRRVLAPEELARVRRERGTNTRSSARNRMAGVIVDVKRDGVMAQIDLACGPYRIVSLMSREAADELDLKPGQTATAVVKSPMVIVERP
ncbi:MAG TPA: TOBE domain-containing protein, partial [Solirubrobacteraceae bacterium]|nr:TOBE domain-containing protein [Solirubrobacteraceae bacterium]